LGGRWNAFTSWDFTAYHEVLPAAHLPAVIALEADRMRNTLFEPEEVESERTVIIAEREGAENFPTSHLSEEVSALAFKVHPYRYPVIGWKSDLRRITRDDLQRHYQTYYHPRNALAVVVGAFQPSEVLEQLRRAFGTWDPGPEIPPVQVEEPPQEGERRVVVQRPGGATAYLQMAFRVPPAAHPDFPALLVLDGVLTGLGGGRQANGGGAARSSRLYRALVDRGLAAEVTSSVYPTRDPGLLRIGATAQAGVLPAAIEEAVLEQLDLLTREEVPPEELARVKRQARAQFVYARDGVHGLGYLIGFYAMVDRPDAFFTLQDRLERVTGADVQRVAAATFSQRQRTVGWYLPEGGAQGIAAVAAPTPPLAHYRPPAQGVAAESAVVGPAQIVRTVLPNGLRLLAVDRPGSGMVALHALVGAGSRFDGDRPGLARFVSAALQRGSREHSGQELAEELDGLGATLAVLPGAEMIGIAGRALSEDLPTYLRLVAEVLTAPTFPPDEVEKVRGELLTALRVGATDTRYMAERLFRRLAFPPDHPHAQPPAGEEEVLQSLDSASLAAFHARFFRPQRTILVLVGDVRPERAVAEAERTLGDWPRGATIADPPAPPCPPPALRRETVVLPGKAQADVVLGGIAVERRNPAYYAVALATHILGGQGMMGRVGQRVREAMGLAYYAFVEARAGLLAGPWWARAGVHPDHIPRVVDAILEEVGRFQQEGPTPAEVSDARDYFIGSLAVRLETHGGLAAALAEMELYDLGLDYLLRYPMIIRAVSPAEIQQAAQRFPTDHYSLAVAGPPSSLAGGAG
ncbi:MAG: pitrilysin family protein, partial [Armatimonadota bacterium]|nr:pitrilysin family protein [Armatimonadota bacterium]